MEIKPFVDVLAQKLEPSSREDFDYLVSRDFRLNSTESVLSFIQHSSSFRALLTAAWIFFSRQENSNGFSEEFMKVIVQETSKANLAVIGASIPPCIQKLIAVIMYDT